MIEHTFEEHAEPAAKVDDTIGAMTNDDFEDGAGTGETTDETLPDGLPEKFWDSERQQIRTDELAKSYRALEQKLGSYDGLNIPESPDDYDIDINDQGIQIDPGVNAKLHEAGFSQDQVQLVYDLAGEVLSPMMGNLASDLAIENDKKRLIEHFGGEQKWGEISQQIKAWGLEKLGSSSFDSLASSYDGVVALHKMMGGREPGLISDGHASNGGLSEQGLKDLMRDPRYWRDHEPAFVNRVKDGFVHLFPEKE